MNEQPAMCTSSAFEQALLQRTGRYVETYMKNGRYDGSHDWGHVQRVLRIAVHLMNKEHERRYSPLLVKMGVLLHDIADHKYVLDSNDELSGTPTTASGTTHQLLAFHLHKLEVPSPLANTLLEIIPAISWSFSMSHPKVVHRLVHAHAELALIQDADRLDALGAIGISRAFTFGGARQRSLEDTLEHFEQKLYLLQHSMWTTEAQSMAQARTKKLRCFQQWCTEESQLHLCELAPT